MKKIFYPLFITLVGLAASQTVSAAEPATVVIFGDSITSATGYSGCGLLPGQEEACEDFVNRPRNGVLNSGFPSQELTRILTESRRPAQVPNWGHGGTPTGLNSNGEGSFSGVSRIGRNLAQSKSEHPSEQLIVLIMYGTNDPNFGISASDTGFNHRVMIDKARNEDFIPVVATIIPRTGTSHAEINNAIKNAAATASPAAPLVDMFAAFNPSLLLPDGHPSAAGYTVIAETWFNDYLAANIEQAAPTLAPIYLLLLSDD